MSREEGVRGCPRKEKMLCESEVTDEKWGCGGVPRKKIEILLRK